MGAYSRVSLGHDTSGRPLVLNRRTLRMLRAVERRLSKLAGRPVRLTIVQGSYRAGNGAAASADTHDAGGVLDVRTWDLASKGITVAQLVRELRLAGFAAWLRDQRHGRMDSHVHAVAIGDKQLSRGARQQVVAYRHGRDGLVGNGPDYHPRVAIRPWPLVWRIRAAKRAAGEVARWRRAHD